MSIIDIVRVQPSGKHPFKFSKIDNKINNILDNTYAPNILKVNAIVH